MTGPRPSPPLGRPRRPGREARREQILRAAMECFARHGYRGTTTRSLATRVGITEAALYRYFPSKDSLYTAIIEEKIAAPELVDEIAAAAARRDDEEVFRGLAAGIARRVEADPTFLRILFFTALEGHARSEPFFASRVRRLREFVSDYIGWRIDEGAFRAIDPVLAARAFLGMVFDHLNVRLIFGQESVYPQPPAEVVDTFVSIFLRGVRADAEGPAR